MHIPGANYRSAQGNLVKRCLWYPSDNGNHPDQPLMVQALVVDSESSVNIMTHICKYTNDYNCLRDSVAAGRSYDDVVPYFRKAEANNRLAVSEHSTVGPIKVSYIDAIHPLGRAWLLAWQGMGLSQNPDFNPGEQTEAGLYHITARWRSSATVAYVHLALHRPSFTQLDKARVTRFILEKSRAVGVEFRRGAAIPPLAGYPAGQLHRYNR